MHFVITNNNYNPAGGGRCPASFQGGAKCKNKPNKANKSIFTVFCSLDNKSINHKAKHRQNANKPPKMTNHYENKNK